MGLILYHFEIVLQQIHAFLSSTWSIIPPPPNPTNKMSSICITTPHRPYEIKNQAIILINSIKRDQRLVHPKFLPYLDRFIRGFVTNFL